MKIRNGFVSNSSSASYTIIIDLDIDAFTNIVMGEMWYLKDTYTKWVKDRIKYLKKSLKNNNFPFTTDDYTKEMERLQKLNIDDMNEQQLISDFFKINHCNLSYKKGVVELHHFNAMHNSYNDVPELMKHIITLFSFQYKDIKIVCISTGE